MARFGATDVSRLKVELWRFHQTVIGCTAACQFQPKAGLEATIIDSQKYICSQQKSVCQREVNNLLPSLTDPHH